MEQPSRRAVLVTGTLALSSLTGCAESGSDTSGTGGGTEDQTAATETGGEATATETPDLDRREANVTAVALGEGDDGSYRFDVTLYHDDDGEAGYANWWQVETVAGEQLGRRELLHAHSTQPFTRSKTIQVPADVDCVVVRGHDQTHGYGGQAMLVAVPGGETRPRQQGADRRSFDEGDCP